MKTKSALKHYRKLIEEINRQRQTLEKSEDRWLKEKAQYLLERGRLTGTPKDDISIEAFALVCETSRRVLNMQPYDVQIAAALAMNEGQLAQMQTGEGKTLAAVLPAYLNALTHKGVHILTFNDYLARRDAQWMAPIYRFLGLTIGYVQENMSLRERKKAYSADITYLTAREAGFDFLRDQRSTQQDQLVQRPFHYVIVDEADSILIDEARVPLVIAGEMPLNQYDPNKLASIVQKLEPETHYYLDEYSRDVNFTEEGITHMEEELNCTDLHADRNNQLLAASNLALQANLLLTRDIDYIVRNGQIQLIDAFTGRVAHRRRWPYGLQTAIEAKEGLPLQPEGKILGSITLQHFIQLYPKVAGMTATAKTSEEEFHEFYDLDVVEIPPNKPCIRIDLPDIVFTHRAAKQKKLLREIATHHATGRPILVGTASVEESELLARQLKETGIDCHVLNAKNDEAEAAIIAEAGDIGAVTISTNMAGRGTDIRLGGADQENREKVVALGGLYVIGTNRHESRRIDHQLRGRAGRQGDPGTSRFFISLEDDLMVRYNIKDLIPRKHLPQTQDAPLQNPVIHREIARAQRIIESQNLEIRKTLFKYSFIIEEQRKILQAKRHELVMGREYVALLQLHSDTAERYHQLSRTIDPVILNRVCKQIALYHIDKTWADHLEYMSQIKEGIHLMAIAGKNPSFEFQKIAINAFAEAHRQMETAILETFKTVHITETGIDMKKEGMERPTSTWTYLINDMPFMNPLHQALISSNAFAFGAALFIVQNLFLLPLLLLWRFLRKVVKKK